MNTDYSYCSGVTCSIRKSCKRYLPDPPDRFDKKEITLAILATEILHI